MKRLLIIASVIISIVLYACKHTAPDQPLITFPGGPTGGPGPTGRTTVCFQSEILPIFINKCATSGCHDAASHKGGYVLDSYNNLFMKDNRREKNNIDTIHYRPEDSKLFNVLISGKIMPPPPNNLPPDQINLIAQWIREGAQQTTCSSGPGAVSCDTNQFKFAANIQPILQKYCIQCHSGINPPAGIRLTTYDSVKMVSGRLYGAVAHLPGYIPMPQNSVNQIPDCNIAQIRKWVAAGANND
jgi:hypothetical protein